MFLESLFLLWPWSAHALSNVGDTDLHPELGLTSGDGLASAESTSLDVRRVDIMMSWIVANNLKLSSSDDAFIYIRE